MERKLMIAPSMGCCDLFDMERQVRIIDENQNFLHMDIKDGVYVTKLWNRTRISSSIKGQS